MGTSNYSDEFKRDAVHPLPGSRNAVSMRGGSRCGGIRLGRFPGDWGSARIRSTSG